MSPIVRTCRGNTSFFVIMALALAGCEVAPADTGASDVGMLDTGTLDTGTLDAAPPDDSSDAPADGVDGDSSEPPGPSADVASGTDPAPVLSLVAARGGPSSLAVVTGALPGVSVVLYGSVLVDGEPSCPKALVGACLSLVGAGWVGEVAADPAGVATFVVTPREETLHLQAATWTTGAPGVAAAFVTDVVPLDGAAPRCPGLAKGADPDLDGLDTPFEDGLGTDPCQADTDLDGLGDGAEQKGGSSPLLADTDGDGKLDGVEVLSGGEPLNPVGPTVVDPDDLDADGIPNWLDVEACDGLDNDGDGKVDEGFVTADTDGDGTPDCREVEDCDCVDDDGDGRIAEHCRYSLQLVYQVDQSGNLFFDGTAVLSGNSQQSTTTRIVTGGRHVVAMQGMSTAGKSGLRMLARTGSVPLLTSGDPGWLLPPTPPGAWVNAVSGSPAFTTGCVSAAANTAAPILSAAGVAGLSASLDAGGCAAGGYVRAVHELQVCGDAGRLEVCNGLDDTSDGLVDEGLPDADGDGICDAVDTESCDGLDNDGDGQVDEGLPDADGDGICNARDWEICNKADDDGDGLIDEAIDLDADGISDCAEAFCGQPGQPLLGYVRQGQLLSMNPVSGTRTVLAPTFPYLSDLVVDLDREVWSVGNRSEPGGAYGRVYAVISKIRWGTNPVQIPVMEIGPWDYPNVDATFETGSAITFDADGTMIVGFANSLWRVDPVARTAAAFVTEASLEFIRDFTWYRGHLLVSGWRRGVGPMLYRWNRALGRLEEVHAFGGFHPQSLAATSGGALYVGLGSNFCSAGDGACTYDHTLSRFTPETGLFQHLHPIGLAAGSNVGGLHAAEFPDNLCEAYVEVCDGVDNDQNGVVDDGFDLDQNGQPDCVDALADTDGDGIVDRDDIEVCDKRDNDGSGVIDDHVDLDGDGVSDCQQDPCTTPAVEFLATGQIGYGPSAIFRWLPATNTFTRIRGRSWNTPGLGDELWIGDLAVSADRGLYAIGVGPAGGGIFQLDARTGFPLLVSPPLSITAGQVGLAIDAAGNFYYALGAQIFLWRPGGPPAVLYATAPQLVTDLTVHRGALWAASQNGVYRVQVLTSGPSFVNSTPAPLAYVTGLSGSATGPLRLGRCNGNTCPIQQIDPVASTLTTLVDWYQGTLPSDAQADGLGGIAAGSCVALAETCDGWDNTGDGHIDEGFPDTDGDGAANCVDPESCNCDDDDGDGVIDEGCSYELAVHVASDDTTSVWVDSQHLGFVSGWTHPTLLRRTISAGTHRIGLVTTSGAGPAGGVRAAVSANGRLLTVTGDGTWRRVASQHGSYGMTSAVVATPIANPLWPGPALLGEVGAQWLWTNLGPKPSPVGNLTVTADVVVCGSGQDAERCDGLDNDGDGQIDEGFPGGGSAAAYCALAELLCDGADDDGDGQTDEGFPDSDLDGTADCQEDEACDGLDNDGDGETDEGHDSDADGVPNCFDVEVCDGQDNDGDSVVDEGFDLNNNGTADCYEPELCDCKDNDGDGAVDETCEYALDLAIAGSASWQAILDGAPWGAGTTWNQVARLSTIVGGGVHRIAVKIDAGKAPVAGFIASGTLAGLPLSETGSGDWHVGATTPPGWTLVTPGSFQSEVVSALPPPMLPGLATAVWTWTEDGRKPKSWPMNAAVLEVFACGERTAASEDPCNGFDDDRDGVIDEGYPDADGDGLANCVDAEKTCDGKDDDGDGFTDEGFSDLDMDGLADCKDTESCDGLDNDGDGLVDELLPGCGPDVPETACNCIDDDLDGVVDDGCLYTIRVLAEAIGDVRLFGRGAPIGEAVGLAEGEVGSVGATESVALGISGTTGGGTLGGLRAAVEMKRPGETAWTRLEVAGPTTWSGSAEVDPPLAWLKDGFATAAKASKCKPAGSAELIDAPWLWDGECSGVTPTPEYRIARRIVICK